MSDGLPPEILSSRGFDALGLDFPLFQAPIAQAREFAGSGCCDLCLRQSVPCFALDSGAELLVECERCFEELPLDAGARSGGTCPACGAALAFPLARTGRLRACAACLQAGLVALDKHTELGDVRWADALAGLTGGGEGLSHPDAPLVPDADDPSRLRAVIDRVALLELVRTPGFDSWSGRGRWLFCCALPMAYQGCWSPADFAGMSRLGDGLRAFVNTIDGGDASGWSALCGGSIEAHVFRCVSCGQLRGTPEPRGGD